MGEDDISVVFAKFCDAVARYDVDAAGRLVSEHLGAFVLHDLEGTRVALAGLDIRSALRYPAVAVLHPRQHELARFFPKKSQLPWFSRGVADDVTLRPMYLMAFLREAGRVKLAGRYADQVVEGLLVPTAPVVGSLGGAGDEWLTWFQVGRTRLAAGELQQAHGDLTTALGFVPNREGKPHAAARVTLGYLGLVAALMNDTVLARRYLDRAQSDVARVGG